MKDNMCRFSRPNQNKAVYLQKSTLHASNKSAVAMSETEETDGSVTGTIHQVSSILIM